MVSKIYPINITPDLVERAFLWITKHPFHLYGYETSESENKRPNIITKDTPMALIAQEIVNVLFKRDTWRTVQCPFIPNWRTPFMQGRSSEKEKSRFWFIWESLSFSLSLEGQFSWIWNSWLTVILLQCFEYINILHSCPRFLMRNPLRFLLAKIW